MSTQLTTLPVMIVIAVVRHGIAQFRVKKAHGLITDTTAQRSVALLTASSWVSLVFLLMAAFAICRMSWGFTD